MTKLKGIMDLLCMSSETKEEAFLKGLLMGYGTYLACPTPHWELIKEYPDSIDIEREMKEIFDEVHRNGIEEAERLLASIKV